jgi:hypothetical protein
MANLSNGNLNIYYQNVRGLRTKCLQLYNNTLTCDYDILSFTETWLKDDINNAELIDDRYEIFRCDRDCLTTNKTKGGGVMLCVRRELAAEQCAVWRGTRITESLCVSIPARAIKSSKSIHIILVYLPPDLNDFGVRYNEIDSNINHIINSFPSDYVIVLGDFNLPCIFWKSHSEFFNLNSGPRVVSDAANAFVDNIYLLGLNQFNLTRNSNGNILDLCFSNTPCLISQCLQPIISEDKYHPAITIDVLDLLDISKSNIVLNIGDNLCSRRKHKDLTFIDVITMKLTLT